MTCYLAAQRTFVRWIAADSEAELLGAAREALDDPDTEWELCGVWETDGSAVLMDSANAGTDLGQEYPGGGKPEQTAVAIPPGRWTVLATYQNVDSPWVGLVRLVPAS